MMAVSYFCIYKYTEICEITNQQIKCVQAVNKNIQIQ